jgi:predicted  nucleic acid-binding Zn-ribbon protein
MNKGQINRKEMHDSVIYYLDDSTEKWSFIPKVGEFKNELATVNDQIEQSQAAQQSAQVYLSKAKKKLKRTIATKADILNDALEAFAVVTGDVKLENKMNDSFSDLFRTTNLAFIPKIKEVIEVAETHINVLQAEYGVTPEQIDDLKVDLDNFLELNGQPRAYQIASVQASKDLEQLFSEAHEILSKKLDKVMTIFKRRDPNFYNGYLAARVVVDN